MNEAALKLVSAAIVVGGDPAIDRDARQRVLSALRDYADAVADMMLIAQGKIGDAIVTVNRHNMTYVKLAMAVRDADLSPAKAS